MQSYILRLRYVRETFPYERAPGMQLKYIDKYGPYREKRVFGVSKQVKPKLTCSATETSYNIKTLQVAELTRYYTLDRANNKGADQTAWVHCLGAYAGLCFCCLHATKLGFLAWRPT